MPIVESYIIEVKYKWVSEETAMVQEKCTRQHAQIAKPNVKFHSYQPQADQYTAENVIRSIDASNLDEP